MNWKNYIIEGIAGLSLLGCASTERWPEPPIADKPAAIHQAVQPEQEPQKLVMQIPFAYKFDKPSTRNIFNGLVKLATKKDEPTILETLVFAANIGKDGLVTAEEVAEFCKKAGINPEYLPSEQNISHKEEIDVTDTNIPVLIELINAVKKSPKQEKTQPTPTEPPKPTEYLHKIAVSYENEQVKALANGYVNAMIALSKRTDDKKQFTPEDRMTIYRSIAGTDNIITENELEARIGEHTLTVEQLKADGNKYDDLTVRAQYTPQDPESIEIRVTMPEDQVARIKELISKYKPDDMDVYAALKKYSKEQEVTKALVMTGQDVDALAADWEKAYQ